MTTPQFPAHENPRVWVISGGSSLLGAFVANQALAHGDCVVKGTSLSTTEAEDARAEAFEEYLLSCNPITEETKGQRLREVPCDIRRVSECQALIAEAVNAFSRIDILLCCSSQALIGSVEELSATEHAHWLLRDQFEVSYFGPVNVIRAALPCFRRQMSGHIISVGGITGHLGTPGLGAYCAAGWALEGFCDTLAYEIAPFNTKVTTLQANIEIGILTNTIISVPPTAAYSPEANPAPLFRYMLSSMLSRLTPTSGNVQASGEERVTDRPSTAERGLTSNRGLEDSTCSSQLEKGVDRLQVPLSPIQAHALLAETVHAITAIAGHANPPARHIVGTEGITSVKEKLRTMTEELEDFIDCSFAVDINPDNNL